MKLNVTLILIFFLVPSAPVLAEPPQSEVASTQDVLFVGNSFIYYNNSLHNHYRRLLRASYPSAESIGYARIMTISGGYLPEHTAVPAILESRQWDVVVLQGNSRGPISDESAEPFREAARSLAKSIRDAGAEPVFFMTWAYSDKPEMTALLDTAYTDIGRELDADVVPVGLAFATVTSERPDIKLRTFDKRHPALAGTYLAACTFFAVLQNKSPEGLSYDAGLDAETATYLQGVAWESVRAYQERENSN